MQNNIVKLILEIEKRPAMYIGRNSIFCLKAFLDGWHFRNPKQTDNSEILIEFTDWIQAKFNIDRYSVSWDKLLFSLYYDEEMALNSFFLNFNQFLQEKKSVI
jgi:hypothetical protein